jgi:hypothetical protein
MNKIYYNVLIIILLSILILLYVFKKPEYFFTSNDNIDDIKISVIILSYNRPHNLQQNIDNLVKIKQIDNIYILHGHKDYKKVILHPKVINIDDWENNKKYYVWRCLEFAKNCKNENIFILPDDLTVNQNHMNNLIKEYLKDKNNYYGSAKRSCTKNGYKINCANDCNYILNRHFLTSKSVIINIWDQIKKQTNLFDWVIDRQGQGEDIVICHVFKKLYNKSPKYVSGHVANDNLDDKNGFSTKPNYNHIELRSNLCKILYN